MPGEQLARGEGVGVPDNQTCVLVTGREVFTRVGDCNGDDLAGVTEEVPVALLVLVALSPEELLGCPSWGDVRVVMLLCSI